MNLKEEVEPKIAEGWTSIKPSRPCIFISKTYGNVYGTNAVYYKRWWLTTSTRKTLILKNEDYNSYNYNKFKADEYLVLEYEQLEEK